MKTALALLAGALVLLVTMPIWFYLQYRVLSMIGATDVMWILFWIYVPASVVAGATGQVIKALGTD